MTYHDYEVKLGQRKLVVNLRQLPDGKIEQFLVMPEQ